MKQNISLCLRAPLPLSFELLTFTRVNYSLFKHQCYCINLSLKKNSPGSLKFYSFNDYKSSNHTMLAVKLPAMLGENINGKLPGIKPIKSAGFIEQPIAYTGRISYKILNKKNALSMKNFNETYFGFSKFSGIKIFKKNILSVSRKTVS